MDQGPPKKKVKNVKKSEEAAGPSGQADAPSSAGRKKAWHESKKLMKRIALLLENPAIIPPDVFFHVGGDGKLFCGHRIFFALASPVFHATFYEDSKMQGSFLIIPDITPGAFRCLMEYAYTNSTASISLTNVMDVLAASQKYLMTKLSRYCYEFVQENLSAFDACDLWKKARQAGLEIIEKQITAELKRNCLKAVVSDSFLELPQDMILQLSSWDDLKIPEYELYQKIKKWTAHQEEAGRHVKYDRGEGGILQNIRFAQIPIRYLGPLHVASNVLTPEELQELRLHELTGSGLISFNPTKRNPVASPFRLSFSIFVSREPPGRMKLSTRGLLGKIEILVWPDMAPKACEVLRGFALFGHNFELSLMVHPQDNRTTTFQRIVQNGASVEEAPTGPFPQSLQTLHDIEMTSPLWSSPDFVCFKFSNEEPNMPELTILNSNLTAMGGKLPDSVFGQVSEFGVVIGRVVAGPIDRVREFAASTHRACEEFGVANEERLWKKHFFLFPTAFECSVH